MTAFRRARAARAATDRRPSPRAFSVNLGEVWAWVLLWSSLAFLPTAFGALPDAAFYLALACTAGLGLSLSLNAVLNRRARPPRTAPAQDTGPRPSTTARFRRWFATEE